MVDARFRLLMLACHLPVVAKRCDYLHCGGVSFLSSQPWRINPLFSTLYISIPLELWSLIILESVQCAFNRFLSDANDADMNLNTSSECSVVMSMQGFARSEIIRILAGQLCTVAAMADFTLVELAENNHLYPWVAMERNDRENVVLDDFTPMLTLESNSNVTSPRSNNLSTSNHASLDSRHWSPSSGGLRSGLCLYVISLRVFGIVNQTLFVCE
ncbi:hypothetical protein Tco_0808167 [Tanacetum coccineum]